MRKIINKSDFIKMYNSGITLREMGKKLGVSFMTIRYWASKLKLTPRGKNKKIIIKDDK